VFWVFDFLFFQLGCVLCYRVLHISYIFGGVGGLGPN